MYGRVLNEDGTEFGSFEVFHSDEFQGCGLEEGWYWWARFPGYLPDGEPIGPFETAEEAFADARKGHL